MALLENGQWLGLLVLGLLLALSLGFYSWRRRRVGTSKALDVDALALADVYVAHGRKAQAIALLENAQLSAAYREDIADRLKVLRGK